MVVMLTKEMLGNVDGLQQQSGSQRWRLTIGSNSKRNLFNFLVSLRSGVCGGVQVRVGQLKDFINMTCIESLDFLVSSRSYGEMEDWHQVLKGSQPISEDCRRLPLSNEKLSRVPGRGRTVRKKDNSSSTSGTPQSAGLKSPYYSDEATPIRSDDFKLLDHVDMDKIELGPAAAASSPRPSSPSVRPVALFVCYSCSSLTFLYIYLISFGTYRRVEDPQRKFDHC